VVGVIVLFLGVAIAPSINANLSKASIDSELVEITTEICGLNGGKHTVSLSKEDAEEVDRLFNSIKERLDNVVTREDTVEIFNEAVVELDKYGLLGGLSVKQAQRLVTGGYQNRRVMKALEKLYSRNQELYDNNSNLLCLVAGRTTYTSCFGFVESVLWTILYSSVWFVESLFDFLYNFIWILYDEFNIKACLLLLNLLDDLLISFWGAMFMLELFIWVNPVSSICPLPIGYLLGLGLIIRYPQGVPELIPSEGFINSYGLNGNKQWSGKFWGQGTYIPSHLFPLWGGSPVGVAGFTGIKIILELENGNTSFLGSALWLKLGPKRP
jgi:hypothetical protein